MKGKGKILQLPLGIMQETQGPFTPVGTTRELSPSEQEIVAELMQQCKGLSISGAVVIIPAWEEIITAPVVELAMPDGEPMAVIISRPIPEGQGLLITSDGEGGITARLAYPQEGPDGQASVLVPVEEEPQPDKLAMFVPGPNTKQ